MESLQYYTKEWSNILFEIIVQLHRILKTIWACTFLFRTHYFKLKRREHNTFIVVDRFISSKQCIFL